MPFNWLTVVDAIAGFRSRAWAQQPFDTDGREIHVALELFIVPLVIICIIWAIWKLRTKKQDADKTALDEAWRTVLSDPNYLRRRRFEEYKSNVNAQAHEAETRARRLEGL